MATYQSICESVLEEANGRPVVFPSMSLGIDPATNDYYVQDPTQRNIIRWVDDLYLQTQQRMLNARFMHKRGLFITTAQGTEEYLKPGIREVARFSFYAVKDGQTARIPQQVLDYDFWVQQERVRHFPESNPLWLIRKPDFKWLVYPPPSAVWRIYGEWWLKPTRFCESDEEPRWDEEYHDVLKWKALQLFAAEFSMSNDAAENPLMKRIAMMLPPLEKAFHQRYLEPIKPARPLMS